MARISVAQSGSGLRKPFRSYSETAGNLHASWPVLAAFGYIIWRPVSNSSILYPALGLMALSGLADLLVSGRRTTVRILAGAWLFLTVALVSLFYGSARGNPGVAHQAATWIIGPTAWSLWAFAIRRETLRRVVGVILVAGVLLSLNIILYAAGAVGILPRILPEALLMAQNAGIDVTSGTALRFYGLSSLSMIAPMAATAAITRGDGILPSRITLAGAAILCSTAAYLGGRRAIVVVAVAIPVVLLLVRAALLLRREALRAVAIGLSVTLGLWAVASYDSMWQVRDSLSAAVSTFSGIDVGSEDAVRLTQSVELWKGFSLHPWMGAGLGAGLESGYLRSYERPWQFELQYHSHLYSLGVVGSLFLLISASVLASEVFRAWVKDSAMRPTLSVAAVGAVAILVANASNPYLQAVGHQWAIPLCLGVASAALRIGSSSETNMVRTVTGARE